MVEQGSDRRWTHRLSWAVGALLLLFFVACASPQEKGDRAMELGNYGAAMAYYEAEIDSGSEDPRLYYNAARAAQRQGAFGKAERYFSRSLRYGGGVDVARSLAEFYVQTSNFSQAVKVFQYLVRIEEDVQPLYNNIGTALMYAGHYLDAESYLLMAQQMNPNDPVPYVNLGALYDRHLRNWPRAVTFYDCYTQMSNNPTQVRTVRTRLQEMSNQRNVDTSRVGLECGKKYQAKQPERQDLRTVFGLGADGEWGEEEWPQEDEIVIESLNVDTPLEYEPERVNGERTSEDSPGEDGEIEIVDSAEEVEVQQEEPAGEQREMATATSQHLEQGVEAFDTGRYDEAVEAFERVSEQQRGIEETSMLGRALYQIGRFQDAVSFLEEVIEKKPTPEVAAVLVSAYHRQGDRRGARRICERFGDWPDYQEALAQCE